MTPSQTDLNHIIFGNLLGVSSSDLLQVAILGALALSILLIKRRDLTLFAFDPIHANAIGLSPKRLGALLLGVLALTSVVALQAVGVVLVVAMLIIPGATAYLLTDKFFTDAGDSSRRFRSLRDYRYLRQLLPRHGFRWHGRLDAGHRVRSGVPVQPVARGDREMDFAAA